MRSVQCDLYRGISRHSQRGDPFQANFPSKSESHRKLQEIESTASIGILVARFVEKKNYFQDPIVLKTGERKRENFARDDSRGPWFEWQGCREDRLQGEIGVVHQITRCPRTACKSYLNWRWQVYPLAGTCMLPLSQLRGMAVSSLGRRCHHLFVHPRRSCRGSENTGLLFMRTEATVF